MTKQSLPLKVVLNQGFARLFRTFAISLNESTPLVETMARSFDRISFYASETLLSVQSMTRFFQGRDSLLGDKLFPDEESKNKAFLFLEQFKTTMTEMDKLTENIYNGWSMILEKLSSSKILDTFNTSLLITGQQARLAAMHKNQYALPGVNQPLNGMNAANLEIKMDVKISAANPEDFNQKFQDQFKSVIQSTLQQYSQKE
jgi:hypothetical protein